MAGGQADYSSARHSLAPAVKLNAVERVQPQFNHIALHVTDLRKSVAFYRDVIGADIIDDPFRDDRHVWLRIGEHNQLHLITGSQLPEPGNMHFAFSVPSLDKFAVGLVKHAVSYDDGHGYPNRARLRPDGVQQIYFHDPDGYSIEVNEDQY